MLPKKTYETQLAFLMLALSFALAISACAQVTISPPNYTVTTPASAAKFYVNGLSSAVPAQEANVNNSLNFSLPAGATYIFNMNSTQDLHPVDICTAANTSSHYSGASAQAQSGDVIVTLAIPRTNYPATLYYICNNHQFYGKITVTAPQPPPTANIVQTSVTSNITLTFIGGTNTIQLVPEFSSNLVSGAWLSVPSYTNTFSGSATNTTSFNRLDAICGPNVFLRLKQASP